MSRAARKARRKHSTSALDDFAWKALDVTQVKKETFAYGGFMMLQTIPGSSVEVVRSASGLSMKAKKRPASSDPEAAAASKGKKQRKANDGAAAAPAAAASASAAASQSGATAAPGKVVAMPPKSKKSKKKTLKAKAKASAAAGTAAADASSSSSSSSAAAVTAPSPGEVKAAADRKAAKKAKAKRKRKLNKKKKKAEVAAAKAAAAAAGQTVAVAPLDGSVDYGMWEGYGVSEFLLRALQRLGFGAPTTVQSMCLAAAIGGRKDIAAAAPTGSGKTLAFGLPVLHQLLAMPQLTAEEAKAAEVLPAKPPAIVIAPTRELAMQVAKHLRAVCVGSVLQRRGTIVTLVGGMADVKQKRLLSFNPQVVVATPGRLYDLLEAEAISLDHVKFAILDEADRLSLPNSFPSLPKIFEKITNGVEERQLFVFSATLTIDQPASRLLSMMSQLGMKIKSKKTTIVNLSQSGVAPGSTGAMGGESSSSSSSSSRSGGKGKGGGVGDGSAVRLPSTLALLQLRCVEAEKAAHLYYFYTQNPGRTLIFCNAISVVQQLTALLNLLNVPAFPLHGKMQQRQRLKNLDRFVSDTKGVLVATDVAARGLDVRQRCSSARPEMLSFFFSLSPLASSPFLRPLLSRFRTSTTSCTSTSQPSPRRSCTAVAAPRARGAPALR